MSQRDPDLPRRVNAQPGLSDRRAQAAAAQPLETFPLAGANNDPRVQVEAADVGVTRTERHRDTVFGRTALALRAGTAPWPERDASLDGCRREAGERPRFLPPRTRRTALVWRRRQPPPLQQAFDPARDHGHNARDVVPRGAAAGMKTQYLVVVRKDAIDHEGVEVHVQVQRSAEPLNHDHRPAAAIRDAVARADAETRARHTRTRPPPPAGDRVPEQPPPPGGDRDPEQIPQAVR